MASWHETVVPEVCDLFLREHLNHFLALDLHLSVAKLKHIGVSLATEIVERVLGESPHGFNAGPFSQVWEAHEQALASVKKLVKWQEVVAFAAVSLSCGLPVFDRLSGEGILSP